MQGAIGRNPEITQLDTEFEFIETWTNRLGIETKKTARQ